MTGVGRKVEVDDEISKALRGKGWKWSFRKTFLGCGAFALSQQDGQREGVS